MTMVYVANALVAAKQLVPLTDLYGNRFVAKTADGTVRVVRIDPKAKGGGEVGNTVYTTAADAIAFIQRGAVKEPTETLLKPTPRVENGRLFLPPGYRAVGLEKADA